MTRKAIEILPWPATMPPSGEYAVANYPRQGLYFHPTNALGYLVLNGSVYSMTQPPGIEKLLIDIPDAIEATVEALPPGDRGGMSENNVLKLVAIIGKPELAEKLCL